MTGLLLNMLVYCVAAFAEYGLASWRTVSTQVGRRNRAALILFVEVLLGLRVLSFLILGGGWDSAIAYSAGAALGWRVGCGRGKRG